MAKQAIKAGSAYVELYADDRRLKKSLSDSEKGLKSFAEQAKAAAVPLLAVGTAAAATVKHFADFGDQMNKMAARTGLTVEALSGLKFAAEQSGASIEAIERGLAGMSRFLLNAERGLSTATDVMKMLGLEIDDILSQSPDDQFRSVMRAIGNIDDPTRKAALAMQVLGRSGRDLLPLVDNIDLLINRAEELGLIISTADAQAAADLTDAMNELWSVIKSVSFEIGSSLAPDLRDTVTTMAELAAKTKKAAAELSNFNDEQREGVTYLGRGRMVAVRPQAPSPFPGAGELTPGVPLGPLMQRMQKAAPYTPNFAGIQQALGVASVRSAARAFLRPGQKAAGILGFATTPSQQLTKTAFESIGRGIAALSNKTGAPLSAGIDALADLAKIKPTLESFSTAGTFSPFAVGGLGGVKGLDAVAANTRTLIVKQEETIRAIEDNAPQFA